MEVEQEPKEEDDGSGMPNTHSHVLCETSGRTLYRLEARNAL